MGIHDNKTYESLSDRTFTKEEVLARARGEWPATAGVPAVPAESVNIERAMDKAIGRMREQIKAAV